MAEAGDSIVAGVSGGADSVCLLLILCSLSRKLDLQLAVVHVDHGIRQEAVEDAAYVRQLCEEMKVPFFLVKKDVPRYAAARHLSLEEAGRQIRYQAFREAAKKLNGRGAVKIAVAHNANDRAETMLFHLFRGTGLTGLGSIRPVRDGIIRPLLGLQRTEIEAYLEEEGRAYCKDKTNEEDTYTRNRIRRHMIPFAEKEVCTGAVLHMCNTADLLGETELYIRGQTGKAYKRCCIWEEDREIVLAVDRLLEEEPFLQGRILLLALEQLVEGRKDVASVHLRGIEKLLEKSGSSQFSLPHGLTVYKEYNRLILRGKKEENQEAVSPNVSLLMSGTNVPLLIPGIQQISGVGAVETKLIERADVDTEGLGIEEWCRKSEFISVKSCTKWFDYDKITRSLVFRTRETGDYLIINAELSRKSLKKYMIEKKIPKSRRGSIYVLADGANILWIPGYRISEYYKVTEETRHILQIQIGGK